MPLADIEISADNTALSDAVVQFLCEADSRVSRFVEKNPKRETGFVPSNFVAVYRTLQTLRAAGLSPSNSFCEWGSGFGVVSCLATMLGYDAIGIEIESVLVDASRTLADDFELSVEFAHGSFVPSGAETHAAEAYTDNNAIYPWLIKDAGDAYADLGISLDSFGIVFAYPWPGEEYMMEKMFEDGAALGSLLVMYSDTDSISIRRNVERPAETKLDPQAGRSTYPAFTRPSASTARLP